MPHRQPLLQPNSDEEGWGAQLRKGCLELAILAALCPRPLYGLDVLRALNRSGLAIGEGTLYAILNRLRNDGSVVSEWSDAGTGHPRKYFTLTKTGRSKMAAMATAWKELSAQMDSILEPTRNEVNRARAK